MQLCIILFGISERSSLLVYLSNSGIFFIMTSFDFKTWCSDHALKQKTIDELGKCDLGSQEALKLVHTDDIATLDLTLGLKKLLLHTLEQLNGAEKGPTASEKRPIETTPVTTKTLASNGGIEELLKKIAGVSLDDPPVTRGATEKPLFVPLQRADNNLQVFLGIQDKTGDEIIIFNLFLFPPL